MAFQFRNGIDLNGKRAQNASDPTTATDLATKQYVDQVARGINDLKDPVRGTTTANLAVATALVNGLVHDGVTYATGDRILLKNQTAGAENGIYVIVASGAASRATDADASDEVTRGMSTTVLEGTTKGTGTTQANPVTYVLTTANPITLGTTTLAFSPIGGTSAGTTYTAGNGLTETPAGTFNVVGASGGGVTVTADAIAVDSSVSRRFAAACVATTNPQTFAHGLGTADLSPVVKRMSDGAIVGADITVDATNITVDWGAAPTAGEYRVIVD